MAPSAFGEAESLAVETSERRREADALGASVFAFALFALGAAAFLTGLALACFFFGGASSSSSSDDVHSMYRFRGSGAGCGCGSDARLGFASAADSSEEVKSIGRFVGLSAVPFAADPPASVATLDAFLCTDAGVGAAATGPGETLAFLVGGWSSSLCAEELLGAGAGLTVVANDVSSDDEEERDTSIWIGALVFGGDDPSGVGVGAWEGAGLADARGRTPAGCETRWRSFRATFGPGLAGSVAFLTLAAEAASSSSSRSRFLPAEDWMGSGCLAGVGGWGVGAFDLIPPAGFLLSPASEASSEDESSISATLLTTLGRIFFGDLPPLRSSSFSCRLTSASRNLASRAFSLANCSCSFFKVALPLIRPPPPRTTGLAVAFDVDVPAIGADSAAGRPSLPELEGEAPCFVPADGRLSGMPGNRTMSSSRSGPALRNVVVEPGDEPILRIGGSGCLTLSRGASEADEDSAREGASEEPDEVEGRMLGALTFGGGREDGLEIGAGTPTTSSKSKSRLAVGTTVLAGPAPPATSGLDGPRSGVPGALRTDAWA